MHYTFIPAVQNKSYMKPNKKGNITKQNTFEEKVSSDALLNKKHLQQFHPNYQRWLDSHGIDATVYSGVTGGKNRTVAELKTETRELLKAKEQIQSLTQENEKLKETIKSLEKKTGTDQNSRNRNGVGFWINLSLGKSCRLVEERRHIS